MSVERWWRRIHVPRGAVAWALSRVVIGVVGRVPGDGRWRNRRIHVYRRWGIALAWSVARCCLRRGLGRVSSWSAEQGRKRRLVGWSERSTKWSAGTQRFHGREIRGRRRREKGSRQVRRRPAHELGPQQLQRRRGRRTGRQRRASCTKGGIYLRRVPMVLPRR